MLSSPSPGCWALKSEDWITFLNRRYETQSNRRLKVKAVRHLNRHGGPRHRVRCRRLLDDPFRTIWVLFVLL